jgi:phosphate transport system substrate-binding protein
MKKLSAIILLAGILFTACTGSIPTDPTDDPNVTAPPTEPSEPSEEITVTAEQARAYLQDNFDKFSIDGSTSMIPLHESLLNLFVEPECEEEGHYVWHSRTVDAFERFVRGNADILLSVDFSQELLDSAKNRGVSLGSRAVTREAFVFLINRSNPVQSLTVEQIKGIYSGEITNWKEVGGDDAAIQAFQRNRDSGSQMRMERFMGDTELSVADVTYISGMGDIIEQIADFDGGKYSIAYNMYTFTEKQYDNEEVVLLDVDGIAPNDDTVFDDSYPIVIYNYIWYNRNNPVASEFALNLHAFLMGEEGQRLISDSGYVNLNLPLDRNLDIEAPWDADSLGTPLRFYNPAKGEFYDIEFENDNWDSGKLVVFDNYADYVLRYNPEHGDNAKAREFLMRIYNSDIELHPGTAWSWEDEIQVTGSYLMEGSYGTHFFNFMFDGLYYMNLVYDLKQDKFELVAPRGEWLDYLDEYMTELFGEYFDNIVADSRVGITESDLRGLYMRKSDSFAPPLEYFKPFE